MSNRFGRDTSRNSLFSNYDATSQRSTSPSKNKSSRPSSGYGYGYTPPASTDPYNGSASNGQGQGAFSAYPSASAQSAGTFRTATPNSKGQYSASVLDELESQNDEQMGALTGKVRDLKNLTNLIGAEIRDSSALAEKMNDQFENSRLKIKGTMTRMLRMAEKTGVGWKVWLGFFAAVIFLFWYVWLF
ncbi:hypothetical protein B0J11DRAFT_537286 [Dendryphion nanum]|uniref:t-SNARE coiled-coil homology domain-containing protein n=1 Tax=Dendryphion nanum TaxID=256645 RepID=A0A9P9DFF2_9PLEO|nr:hypothetical protein B0J11DRAFT_537286 [Dendryphion nanum]